MGLFFDLAKLVSICIPTYKEAGYIVNTLKELSKQTLWSQSEVVIADYAPDGDMTTRDAINALQFANVRVVDCPKSGVGIARKIATESSTAPLILTWSADTRFGIPDGIERLIRPIQNGECLIVHTPNLLDNSDGQSTDFSKVIFPLRNEYEFWASIAGFPLCYEEGLTMSRQTYYRTGGWRDVVMGEAPYLSLDAVTKIGLGIFKYVEDVPVIVSNRRMKKSTAGFLGLPNLDYNFACRDDQVLEVKRHSSEMF